MFVLRVHRHSTGPTPRLCKDLCKIGFGKEKQAPLVDNFYADRFRRGVVPTVDVFVRTAEKCYSHEIFRSHTHFAHILLGSTTMLRQPAYFDSQASAAAALQIDIEELREAKRQGCPAFRSGRVYRDQLLSWLQERDLKKTGSVKANGAGLEENRFVIAQTIRGLSVCANLGVLTPQQYFDFAKTIVDAAKDFELRDVFRQTIANWLQLNYSKIENTKARKAHPKIMRWFSTETKASARRDPAMIDLQAQLRKLREEPIDLRALIGA